MDRQEFIRECTMGGPGLDGYAYRADTYCENCTLTILQEITVVEPSSPLFSDSEAVPQPIFFGEAEQSTHCGNCGEYLYGEDEEEQ